MDLAHALTKRLAYVRKNGEISYLLPDGNAQVTVEYDDFDKPLRIDAVVVSTQHLASAALDEIRQDVIEKVIKPVLPAEMLDENTKYYINPTGRFVIGGPMGDTGLTGRKIIVDTYGGMARHGGGAFSGKDPTKVGPQRMLCGRGMRRKTSWRQGLAKQCELQLAYAIGVAHPVSVRIDTQGTANVKESDIERAICNVMDFRPPGDHRAAGFEKTAV